MHITSRELVRRWYGQIKGQPQSVAQELSNIIGHTIIPSVRFTSFGQSDFAPMSGCIDLVLHTELNSLDEAVGITIRGYRSSYNLEDNELSIGGPDNFLFVRDLKIRPHKTSKGRAIDSETEPALLLAALEIEAEREAMSRHRTMTHRPKLAQAVLSFEAEKAPRFKINDGLKRLALQYMEPDSEPLRSLSAPAGYHGTVTRILRDQASDIVLIELSPQEGINPMDLVFEIPSWAKLYVRQHQEVRSNEPLAAMHLPYKVIAAMRKANHTLDAMWSAVGDYVESSALGLMLRHVWDSEITKWAGMVMASNMILTPEQASEANGVWRDLRGTLGRVCHSHRNPNEIIRSGRREGKISVWNMPSEAIDSELMFYGRTGSVDLLSHPEIVMRPAEAV